MENPSIVDVLNAQFGIPDAVTFAMGFGEMPIVVVETDLATAVFSLYAGHVLSYKPKGGQDVLWVSDSAVYEPGKAIRGGIPVIWPWFGPHPDDPNKPMHGFARRTMWAVHDTRMDDNGQVVVEFIFEETEATKVHWSHDFELRLSVTVGHALVVSLTTLNQSDMDFTYAAALHSYFTVSDINHVSIRGLEDTVYLDKVDGEQQKMQVGPIRIERETDRVYLDTTAVCEIVDSGFNRIITIDKKGSRSTVVWNPWIEKARRMSDFVDEAYRQMVCVETANVASDMVTLAPGESAMLTAVIGVRPLPPE